MQLKQNALNFPLGITVRVGTRPLQALFGEFSVVRITICRHAANVDKSTPAILEERLCKGACTVEVYFLLFSAAAKPIRCVEYDVAAGHSASQSVMIAEVDFHHFDWETRDASTILEIRSDNADAHASTGEHLYKSSSDKAGGTSN